MITCSFFSLNHISLEEGSWLNGYGAFSINPTEVDVVLKYIKNQHVHHHQKKIKDEFRAFLKKYNVDIHEDYVWD